jgi:hypothetical protein
VGEGDKVKSPDVIVIGYGDGKRRPREGMIGVVRAAVFDDVVGSKPPIVADWTPDTIAAMIAAGQLTDLGEIGTWTDAILGEFTGGATEAGSGTRSVSSARDSGADTESKLFVWEERIRPQGNLRRTAPGRGRDLLCDQRRDNVLQRPGPRAGRAGYAGAYTQGWGAYLQEHRRYGGKRADNDGASRLLALLHGEVGTPVDDEGVPPVTPEVVERALTAARSHNLEFMLRDV